MAHSGKDKVELLRTLNITVSDGTSENLHLTRYGVSIPYNVTNFMLFTEDKLVSDILRRFREKQMDILPSNNVEDKNLSSTWNNTIKKMELDDTIENVPFSSYFTEIKEEYNLINTKKKNIREILIKKGICSVTK